MDADRTRQVVQKFLDYRAQNDYEGIRSVLAEDAIWQLPRSVPFPDTVQGSEAIATAMTGDGAKAMGLDYKTFKREISEFIVEGSKAAVLQPLKAKAFNGDDYENLYVWMYFCE